MKLKRSNTFAMQKLIMISRIVNIDMLLEFYQLAVGVRALEVQTEDR